MCGRWPSSPARVSISSNQTLFIMAPSSSPPQRMLSTFTVLELQTFHLFLQLVCMQD